MVFSIQDVFDSTIILDASPKRNAKRIQRSLSLAFFMTDKTMTIQ